MRTLQRWIEQLRDHALAYRMQQHGHVGFFEYRFASDRLDWSRSFRKLCGVDARPRGGIDQWYARMRQADRARVERELWTACALRRPNATLDYGIDVGGAGTRFLSSRVSLVYGDDGRPCRMSAVTVDVTDRHMENLRRARDELFASFSHQVRTPLGALSSAAEVLHTLCPESADAQEACDIVARQTARLAQLLDELGGRYADESSPQSPRHPAWPTH